MANFPCAHRTSIALSASLCFGLALIARSAGAQDAATATTARLPGSPRPIGTGLSPEAPHADPTAGGRAPSFGAPTKKDAWALTIGGSVFAWEAVGFGREPTLPAPNQVSRPLHVPPVVEGQQPFSTNTGGSLFMQYGNSTISGTVNASFNATGKERQGFYSVTNGPQMSQAYLTINPQPIGPVQLQVRVGGFTEAFAGPGQWGWGIFGPLLATRGYGVSTTAQYPVSDTILTNLQLGFQAVPGVPEDFVRGDYTGWLETGINSMVAHAHLGLVYRNEYTARLHYARAWGFDERQFIIDDARDGTMDVAILETRYMATPFGQLGASFGFWNFDEANRIHDGIWWGLDWTKGGMDMLRDYIGLQPLPNGECDPPPPMEDQPAIGEEGICGDPIPGTDPQQNYTGAPVLIPNGDGKLFAISAEYDTSLAALLWHPRPFNGTAPDIRLAIAAAFHWTLQTDDPLFKGASGFQLGATIDYQPFSWLSMPVRFFGEDRDWQYNGRFRVYSVSPGVAFRTNWQSVDRIELIYSRRFYSASVDDNPARPLDKDVIALGAYINF